MDYVFPRDARGTIATVIALREADILVFYDPYCVYPKDPEGYNQVAIIVDERHALCMRRRFVRKKIEAIDWPKLLCSGIRFSIRVNPHDAHREKIVSFLVKHRHNLMTYKAGMAALLSHNMQPFDWGTLFPPPPPSYSSEVEFNTAWDHLLGIVEPGDAIFTTSRNPLSRFIAWSTHGPWSHVATYIGSGEIAEVITTGKRRTQLTSYRDISNRVACYRILGAAPDMRGSFAQFARQDVDEKPTNRYGYKGAIHYGWKSFWGDHGHNLVPNSMIYCGYLEFIAQA